MCETYKQKHTSCELCEEIKEKVALAKMFFGMYAKFNIVCTIRQQKTLTEPFIYR